MRPVFLARGGFASIRGRFSASALAGAAAGNGSNARFNGTRAGLAAETCPDAAPAAMALRKSSADAAAVSSAVLSRGTPGAASVPAAARTLKGGAFAAGAVAAGLLTAAFFGDGFTAATPFGPFLAGGAAPLLAPLGALASRACSCRAMALRMRTISDSSLAGGSPSLTGGNATASVCAGCLEAAACCGVESSSSNVMTKGGRSAPALGRAAAANDGTTAAGALEPAGAASRGSKRRVSAGASSGGSYGRGQGAREARESTRELFAACESCNGHELATAARDAPKRTSPSSSSSALRRSDCSASRRSVSASSISAFFGAALRHLARAARDAAGDEQGCQLSGKACQRSVATQRRTRKRSSAVRLEGRRRVPVVRLYRLERSIWRTRRGRSDAR